MKKKDIPGLWREGRSIEDTVESRCPAARWARDTEATQDSATSPWMLPLPRELPLQLGAAATITRRRSEKNVEAHQHDKTLHELMHETLRKLHDIYYEFHGSSKFQEPSEKKKQEKKKSMQWIL